MEIATSALNVKTTGMTVTADATCAPMRRTGVIRNYLEQTALMGAKVFAHNNENVLGTKNRIDPPYTSIADYLLDRGRLFDESGPLTDEQFEYLTMIAEECDIPFEPKVCFLNSMVLSIIDCDFENRITYCEGFCAGKVGFPFPHAWVLLDDHVVDLTYSLREGSAQEYIEGVPPQKDLRDRVLGEIPKGWKYFGVEYTNFDVAEYYDTHEEIGSIVDDYERGHPLLTRGDRLGNYARPNLKTIPERMANEV